MGIKGSVAKEYLKRFPKTPTRTLSKKLYKDNPEVFKDTGNARDVLRYYRGKRGDKLRDRVKDKTFVEHEDRPFNPFPDLPPGLTYYDDWSPYEIEGERILVLADIHSPYYNRPALMAALEYGKRKQVDTVLILGDLMDFFDVSFWETDPRKRNFQGEIDLTLIVLQTIRDTFPNAKIVFKVGNHDERLERYLIVKAPELLGLEVLCIEHLFQTDEFGIDVVNDKRIVKIGKLNVVHGHEFRRSFFNPVNPARGLFLRGKTTALCGHFHRTSEHAEKTMDGDVLITWSVGCLCDLVPEFDPMNSWNHGVAIIHRNGNGNFYVKNRKIVKGEIY